MHIKLIPNAPKELDRLIKRDEFKALYISAKERAQQNHKTIFTISIQNLITQIAIMVSNILVSPKFYSSHFRDAIEYLGSKIIKNRSVTRHLSATNVNEGGNIVKHTIDSLDIDINTTLYHYNDMIDKLSKAIKLNHFMKFKIYRNKKKNIFGEKQNLKFENLANNKITFELIPKPSIDKFSKKVSFNLKIKSEKKSNDTINFVIYSQIGNRKLKKIKMNLNNSTSRSTEVSLSGKELLNNYFNIKILAMVFRPITEVRQKQESYEKGIWPFKKTVYYTIDYDHTYNKEVFKKEIIMGVKIWLIQKGEIILSNFLRGTNKRKYEEDLMVVKVATIVTGFFLVKGIFKGVKKLKDRKRR